jgi:hypothetical protein
LGAESGGGDGDSGNLVSEVVNLLGKRGDCLADEPGQVVGGVDEGGVVFEGEVERQLWGIVHAAVEFGWKGREGLVLLLLLFFGGFFVGGFMRAFPHRGVACVVERGSRGFTACVEGGLFPGVGTVGCGLVLGKGEVVWGGAEGQMGPRR